MVLPFESHSITFDEVTYAVDMPQVIKKQNKPFEILAFTVLKNYQTLAGNEEPRSC